MQNQEKTQLKKAKLLNMKKIILYTLIFLNINYFCYAQQDSRKNKVETIQIAYLTKQLSLSPEEAQKFWPVYNEYRDELVDVRKDARNDEVLFEEKIINVKKKYKSEFKRVLGSDNRANQVFIAEKDFREMLRKELMNRRGGNRKSNNPNE